MSMKRKLAWMMVGFLTLVGGGAFLYFTRPEPDAISPGNCAKIRKGMGEEEVRTILGGPPSGSYFMGGVPGLNISFVAVWEGKRAVIGVEYDRAGLLTAA